jgi:hypothetical protein
VRELEAVAEQLLKWPLLRYGNLFHIQGLPRGPSRSGSGSPPTWWTGKAGPPVSEGTPQRGLGRQRPFRRTAALNK